MRKLIFLFLLIVLTSIIFGSCATTSTYLFEDEYSDVSYVTKKISLPLQAMGWWNVELRYTEDNENYFILDSWTSDWYFFDTVDMIIDDETKHYEAVNSDRSTVSNGSVKEFVTFKVPLEEIKRMADSELLKIRFSGSDGRKEFDLSSNQNFKNSLMEYLNYLENNNPYNDD